MSPPCQPRRGRAPTAGPADAVRLDQRAEGRIARILLSVPADMAPCLAPALESLLAQLERDVSLLLLTHEASAGAARALLERCGPTDSRLVAVADDLPLALWAQDPVLAGAGPDGPCLLAAEAAPPARVTLVERLAAVTGLPLRRLAGLPDGGNLLAVPGALLLGADDWHDGATAALLGGGGDPEGRRAIEVASRLPVPEQRDRPIRLAGEDWREVLHHGNRPGTRQPIFHIDMFVTPAGRGPDGTPRLLVGDPALATRLLGHPPLDHALTALFDDVAGQLAATGFAVTRNPLPLIYCDVMAEHERRWYFASANNAVVQDRPSGRRIVWLPAYGHGHWPELEASDEANARIWRDLGFEPRLVAQCQPLAENYGGLNCLVKVLRREPDAG